MDRDSLIETYFTALWPLLEKKPAAEAYAFAADRINDGGGGVPHELRVELLAKVYNALFEDGVEPR